MSARFSVSSFSSNCNFFLLIFLVLLRLCLSDQNSDDVLCMDGERQALIRFKHDLTDEADRLASWVGEKTDCCRWAGIVCDNITGHVHEIRLRGLDGHCDRLYLSSYTVFTEGSKQRLRGNLSSSLLDLKQLKYLDLSCNDFEGIQIPSFIGSLSNLRYLNLSESKIGGIIPPQIGNLSELRVLSIGSFYGVFGYSTPTLTSNNIQWLSSLRWLHHLDMSYVNLSEAIDWFQVINTLPSLVQLHMSRCGLRDAHSHVPSLNVTSLSLLDLSFNYFDTTSILRWIFSQTNLVSLDLSYCNFNDPLLGSIYSFGNLTSLESVHVRGNDFMNSPLILKGLSSKVISLDISSCGLSSSVLNSLHNLTSLLSLDLSENQLTEPIPSLLGNLCNMREIHLFSNDFSNISLNCLLQGFFECKLPSLESLTIMGSRLSGPIPYSIGRLSSLKKLRLDANRLNGSIPDSIEQLSSLEELYIGRNQLSGNLPNSLGQLSKLKFFWFPYNLFTGVVTEAHFSKLASLTYINGEGNNLTLKVQADWIPPFKTEILYLNSWSLGPQFPLWLQSQWDLIQLDISNTNISSIMPPESFWRSFPNLTHLDMSKNHIKGALVLGIPATLQVLNLSSNQFKGQLPYFPNGSLTLFYLDLSNNFLEGSISHLICSNDVKEIQALNLGNNDSSGVIPECWDKWPNLQVLNLENNTFSGELPRTLGIPATLQVLKLSSNQFKGQLPYFPNGSLTPVYLDLSNNFFEGSISHLICSTGVKETEVLNLGSNDLSGVIPECWDKWPNLLVLNLENNTLSGELPRTLGSLSKLQWLNMHGNKILGRIPHSLMNLSYLKILDLGRNELVGSIPAWFGTNLTSLRILNLRHNNLKRNIPDELCYLSGTQILDLAHNNLSGNIPRCFNNFSIISGKETNNDVAFYIGMSTASVLLVMKGREDKYTGFIGLVMVLDLSGNNFYGQIPVELTTLLKLKSLNLSRNQLIGRIPDKIGNLQELETLDLSMNRLSGELPNSLSTMNSLSNFNVSCNSLTGRIPVSTQLQSFTESSFIGNKLCGAPLTKLCESDVPDDTREPQKEDDASRGVDWELIVSIMLGFIVGFWIIVAPLIVKKSWRIAYFCFWGELYNGLYKYFFNMFCK